MFLIFKVHAVCRDHLHYHSRLQALSYYIGGICNEVNRSQSMRCNIKSCSIFSPLAWCCLYMTDICTHMHWLVRMYSNMDTVHTYGCICIYNDGVGYSKARDPRSTEQQQFTTGSKLQCCQVEYDRQVGN